MGFIEAHNCLGLFCRYQTCHHPLFPSLDFEYTVNESNNNDNTKLQYEFNPRNPVL